MSDQLDFNDLRPRVIPQDDLERRALLHERAYAQAWSVIHSAVQEALRTPHLSVDARAPFERMLHASGECAQLLPRLRVLPAHQQAG
jgi:hypothetical protein